MTGLEASGRRIGEAARRRAIARLAARVRQQAPDVQVTENSEGVVLKARRLLSDPRLIWIGSLLR